MADTLCSKTRTLSKKQELTLPLSRSQKVLGMHISHLEGWDRLRTREAPTMVIIFSSPGRASFFKPSNPSMDGANE